MPIKAEERWVELCEQVVAEQDSRRLMKLVREMVQLLDERLQKEAKEEAEASEVK